MNIILVICAIIAVTSANPMEYRQQCISELNIQQDTIDKFRKGEYDEFAPCFSECVFKKMGVFSDGSFNIDALTKSMKSDTKSPEELKSDIEECTANSETDNCQKSFKAFLCFKEKGLYKAGYGRPRS